MQFKIERSSALVEAYVLKTSKDLIGHIYWKIKKYMINSVLIFGAREKLTLT